MSGIQRGFLFPFDHGFIVRFCAEIMPKMAEGVFRLE
jgi:hypothetical protein